MARIMSSGGGNLLTTAETFDIYVSSILGSDAAGDGSRSNPYATLTKALTVAANGSRIGMLTGFYTDVCSTALTSLTIKAPSGNTPVIYGATLLTVWAKTGGQTNVYEAACTTASVINFWYLEARLTSVASVATCDTTPNSYYFDDPGDKVYVNVGGAAPADTVYAVAGVAARLSCSGTGVTVDGLTFRYCVQALAISGASSTVKNCTLEHFSADFSRSAMTVSSGGGHSISNCTWEDMEDSSTSCLVVIGTTSGSISGCSVDTALNGYIMASGWTLTNSTADNILFDCVRVNGSTVSYCTATNWGHAAFIGGGTVHHCVANAGAAPTLANNNGYVCEIGQTTFWYHNVCANTKNATGNGYGYYTNTSTSILTMRNNISYNNKAGVKRGDAPTVDSDYNCVNSNTTQYEGTFPVGANDITDDPLFTTPASDFTLQALSPCRGAGEYIAAVSEKNPASIGRYEY